MNFLILRDFYRIFLLFYESNLIYFELKWMKNKFLIAWWHGSSCDANKIIAPCDNVWEHRVSHTCTCAHVWLMRKHLFQNFCYLLNYTTLIYPSNPLIFHHVGLSFYFYMCRWSGVMWSIWSRNQITIVNRHLSEGVRGALLLGDDSFYNILISVVNLKSYNGWD